MSQSTAEANNYAWYSPRNGVALEGHIESILSPPERQLSQEALVEVRTFATDMTEGRGIQGVECQAKRTLKELLAVTVLSDVQSFDIAYFRTSDGEADLAKLGLSADATDEQITTILYDIDYVNSTLSKKGRKEMATRTSDWRRELIAERLATDPSFDEDYAPEKDISVAYEPNNLLSKIEDIQAHRAHLTNLRKCVKSEPQDDTRDAKIVCVEILLGRVNSMLAELYPAAVSLAKQLDNTRDTDDSRILADRLCAAVPFVSAALHSTKAYEANRRTAFLDHWQHRGLRRLDLISNGAGLDADGNISPLDANLIDWAEAYDPSSIDGSVEVAFSDEELSVMDATEWGSTEAKRLAESIAIEWGLKSEYESTWDEVDLRDGPAPDGKWQFVVTPLKKSVAVNGPKKVMFIPEDMRRTITQQAEAGILPLMAHEAGHVLQNEFDEILAEQVPMAKIKGRRSVTPRELGGVLEETEVQASFGRVRPTNLHYLRALQAKENGANPLQVARAFFNSLSDSQRNATEEIIERLRKQAADRSRRFYRAGGHDTQPLDYVEQGFMGEVIASLPKEQRKAFSIGCASFAPVDAATLHKFGLLELPKAIDKDPAQTAIRVFRRDYLPNLMANA